METLMHIFKMDAGAFLALDDEGRIHMGHDQTRTLPEEHGVWQEPLNVEFKKVLHIKNPQSPCAHWSVPVRAELGQTWALKNEKKAVYCGVQWVNVKQVNWISEDPYQEQEKGFVGEKQEVLKDGAMSTRSWAQKR